MDKIDQKLLNILQEDYPLHTNPYLVIAEELAISQDEVLRRINQLKESGIIRRIGAVIDARSMGYYSTLCAASIPEDRIEAAAAIINSYAGVTHNYIREDKFNLWFTLTAENITKSKEILNAIEEKTNIKVYSMPANRLYKIKATMEIGDKSE